MRILICNHLGNEGGGAETYLRELLPVLGHRGHDLAVMHEQAADQSMRLDAVTPGLTCRHIAAPADLARLIGDWRPDVAYVNGLACPDLEEALLRKVPAVLFAHTYHGTCVSGTKRHALPHVCPCARTLGPACLAFYYPRRCGGLNPVTMIRQYALQRRRRALLRCYRAVLVASEHMQKEYRRHGVVAERLHLVPLFPPGQSPDASPPAERPFTNRLLLLGRLTDLKGGGFLLRALPRATHKLGRNLDLTVAGEGPQRAQLERLARRLGLTVEFTGWVNAQRRIQLMRSADLLVVPSVWPEPFGLVGIEAACVGLPAVAFAVGGIPDWLVTGESGELASGHPPTVDGLGEAIIRALAEPSHWARLREGAWRRAQHFTLEKHVTQLVAILKLATVS